MYKKHRHTPASRNNFWRCRCRSVRTRNGGKSYALRVKHAQLPKITYLTLDSEEEARRVGELAEAALNRGEMPSWLQGTRESPYSTIEDVIHAYLRAGKVADSTADVLDTLVKDVGACPLAGLNYDWADAWIRRMKQEAQLKPGTIRKRKGALSRVLDWFGNAHPLHLAKNPLQSLPHGYSGYDAESIDVLRAQGVDTPKDLERNRRIDPDEEERIVAYLKERRAKAKTLEERAEAEGLSLAFQLAPRTAMRLREIYTLTMDQIQLDKKTIFLVKTKNGDDRQVPLNEEARALLAQPWPALEEVRQQGRLLPFWDGTSTKQALQKASWDLSRMFRQVFEAVGSEDLHFHDTRHEAVCRWVLTTSITSEQLQRATGMKDARTVRRYMSLRGSELADVLDRK
jgi:integrase